MQDSTKLELDLTSKEIYGDVKEALSQLAEGMGVASEHVYEAAVRYQFSVGVFYCVAFTLIVLIGFKTITLTLKSKKWDDEDKLHSSTMVLIPSIILGLIFLYHGIPGVISPEYLAIKEIMEVVFSNN